MRFVYILAGWEGSAHDARVLSDAQITYNFITPKGRYWLGDAGYGNSEFVMAPYRGVKYHLKEVRQSDQKPENAKELFNLRHSSLRNVIERIFGVLKRQWQILGGKGCEYSIDTQVDLFCALIGLYNFGKQYREEDLFIDNTTPIDISDISIEESEVIGVGNVWMNQKRDEIATRMWNEYQSYQCIQ
jgi:DDE superfamily endonuclease